MDNETTYLSKVLDFVLSNRQFTNDKGEVITYQRPVLKIEVNGEIYEIEFKLERADVKVLKIADEQK